MGLIKAGLGALGGTLADQWKEYFYCDALGADTIAVKGTRRTDGRSSNTKGSDNIISNGSGIAVADGQCMIIVENGKIVEVCAEAGEFTYDTSSEPSIFAGSLGDSLLKTLSSLSDRFAHGGMAGKDQRVYYFNTKELTGNKFGTATPIPFRVVDSRVGLDVDVALRCNGVYSYKLSDPVLFYTNVCGNIEREYTREELDSQLKTEFISALAPALSRLSSLELRPSQIPAHVAELCDEVNSVLSGKWQSLRGIKVVSIAMNPPSLSDEDAELIKNAQKTAMYRDPTMAAATLVGAQADAMRTAAGNDAGAMAGFMGMNMANAAGGMNPQALYAMGQQAQQQAAPTPAAPEGSWKCSCGAVATAKFCPECGSPKPADEGWVCSCGEVNKGKFCGECGAKKPAGVPQYKCDKCGWEPEKGAKVPKFCPECGDPFDNGDII